MAHACKTQIPEGFCWAWIAIYHIYYYTQIAISFRLMIVCNILYSLFCRAIYIDINIHADSKLFLYSWSTSYYIIGYLLICISRVRLITHLSFWLSKSFVSGWAGIFLKILLEMVKFFIQIIEHKVIGILNIKGIVLMPINNHEHILRRDELINQTKIYEI